VKLRFSLIMLIGSYLLFALLSMSTQQFASAVVLRVKRNDLEMTDSENGLDVDDTVTEITGSKKSMRHH